MQEEPPLAENGSGGGTAAGRVFSPSSMLKGAASWVSTTMGRTPRAAPSNKRLSVNPVALAASDAKYITSQQLESAKVRALARCCGCAAVRCSRRRRCCCSAAPLRRTEDATVVW